MPLRAQKRKVVPIATITANADPYAVVRDGVEQQHLAKKLAVNGWPLIGVGGAMAASAWLPAANPSLGFAVLGAEVILGAVGIVRLLSLVKHY
jgi:hypothetical protein